MSFRIGRLGGSEERGWEEVEWVRLGGSGVRTEGRSGRGREGGEREMRICMLNCVAGFKKQVIILEWIFFFVIDFWIVVSFFLLFSLF